MISYITKDNRGIPSVYRLIALSTDTKPTSGIPNGSILLEINTCKTYMFDGDNHKWWDITGSGGGGGGDDPTSSLVGTGVVGSMIVG